MFKTHHVLPDEVGRQDPVRLFEMLDALDPDVPQAEYAGNDPYLKMFYGQ